MTEPTRIDFPRASSGGTGGDYRHQALELSRAMGRMFVGLRGHQPDPTLFSYIPPDLAIRECVLPLALEGGTLRVAVSTAEPDLSQVRALYPHLQLDLLSAPANEITVLLDQALRT